MFSFLRSCTFVEQKPTIMDNNELIRKGITGTGMFSSGENAEDLTKNDVDELHALEPLGSNIESDSITKKINKLLILRFCFIFEYYF